MTDTDALRAEVERICAVIMERFPGARTITASGKNAYLNKYSWAADKHAVSRNEDRNLVWAAIEAAEGSAPYGMVDAANIWFDGAIYRFVTNGNGVAVIQAMLVFVRAMGVNERVVVVPVGR